MSVIWAGNRGMTIRRVGKIFACASGSGLFAIGSNGNRYCCGKIADVLIWDGVLSKPDIQRLYSGLLSCKCSFACFCRCNCVVLVLILSNRAFVLQYNIL